MALTPDKGGCIYAVDLGWTPDYTRDFTPVWNKAMDEANNLVNGRGFMGVTLVMSGGPHRFLTKPAPISCKTMNLRGWGNATQLIKGFSSLAMEDILIDFTNSGVNQVENLQIVADEGTRGGSLIGSSSKLHAAPAELKLKHITLSGLMGSPTATVDCGVFLDGGKTSGGGSGGGIRSAFLFDVSVWNAITCALYARNVKNMRALALNLVNTPVDPTLGIAWIGAGQDPEVASRITPSENCTLSGQFSGTVIFDGATSSRLDASGIGNVVFTARTSRCLVTQPPGSSYTVTDLGWANRVQ